MLLSIFRVFVSRTASRPPPSSSISRVVRDGRLHCCRLHLLPFATMNFAWPSASSLQVCPRPIMCRVPLCNGGSHETARIGLQSMDGRRWRRPSQTSIALRWLDVYCRRRRHSRSGVPCSNDDDGRTRKMRKCLLSWE